MRRALAAKTRWTTTPPIHQLRVEERPAPKRELPAGVRGTATIHAPVPDSPLDTPKQEIPTGSILRPGLRLYRVVAGAGLESGQTAERQATGTLAA